MLKFKFIALFMLGGLALGLSETSYSQTNQFVSSPRVAKLDTLLQIALEQNLTIKAAEKRYRSISAVPAQVSALPDPVFAYGRWIQAVETRVGPQENVFSLGQGIPFPGKLGLRGKIAGQDAKAAFFQFEAVRRDVVYKVKIAYANLYRIDQSLRFLDDYQAALRDFAKVAATKYATGQGIQAQVLKADVEVSTISTRLLEFERMRTSMVARLNALLNRSADTPIGRAGQVDATSLQLDEQQLVQYAYSRRQELLANQEMITKTEFARKLAKKNYWPDFKIQALYVTIPQVDYLPESGKDPFSLTLGMNIPIWLGKRKAAVTQAEEAQGAEMMKYADLQKSIEAEINDILFQIQTTKETLELYERGLITQAESSLQSATAAYKTGRLDFLNLLDAERMLLQINLAHIREQANYARQLAALERAVGGKLPVSSEQ